MSNPSRMALKKNTCVTILFEFAVLLLLAIIIGVTYLPSLKHTPASDHWCFLVDTIDKRGFREVFNASYSYNRMRRCLPGDTSLYRPLLFALLSAEESAFGNNFALWQATGIVLHIGVCYLVYRLMVKIWFLADTDHPRRFLYSKLIPLILAVFFATNFSIVYLVIWTHINAYLLFVTFALLSILAVLKMGSAQTRPMKIFWLISAWFAALFAMFTYELGLALAGVLGILAAAPVKKSAMRAGLVALFGTIAGVYLAANRLDYQYHLEAGHFSPDQSNSIRMVLENIYQPQTPEHVQRFMFYTLIQPFFPSELEATLPDRLNITEGFDPSSLSPFGVLSAAVVVVWFLLILLGIRWLNPRRDSQKITVIVVLVGLLAGYMMLNILGRMNLRPGEVILAENSYYSYIAFLLFVLFSFTVWTFFFARHPSRLLSIILWLFLGCILVLSALGGIRIYDINRAIADKGEIFREHIHQIDQFIAAHEQEPDFSIMPDFNDREYWVWVGLPYPYILYYPYIDDMPEYLFHAEGTDIVFQEVTDPDDIPPFPELLELQNTFFVYAYENQYWALAYREGYFSPELAAHYETLLVSDSLDDIYAQVTGVVSGETALPQFVEMDYTGYNLIAYQGQYYAVHESTGIANIVGIDPQTARQLRASGLLLSAETLSDIKIQVDALVVNQNPSLVLENYRGYSLVAYHQLYYALDRRLGTVNLYGLDRHIIQHFRNLRQVLVAASAEDLKARVDVIADANSVQVLEEDYQGFNLVKYQNQYYALSTTLGVIDLRVLDAETLEALQASSEILTADSLEALKEAAEAVAFFNTPHLIESNYMGFNVVQYQGRYYALKTSLGSFDLAGIDAARFAELQANNEILSADTLEILKAHVETAASFNIPQLVQEDYRGFNLVRYQDQYYALRLTLGTVELENMETEMLDWLQASQQVLIADTLDALMADVDMLLNASTPVPG